MTKTITKPRPAPLMTETEALMTAVERMARDPAVDPQKVQQFLEMRERLLANSARKAYARAFVELQNNLPTLPAKGIIPNKNGTVKSHYVRWEDAIEILRPILYDNGFSLSHRINTIGTGIEVTTVLLHHEGHQEATTFALPIDVNEYRNKVQDFASTVSYGKRYTAFALLGLVGSDEVDTDGEKAGEKIDEVEFSQLLELCNRIGDEGGTRLVNYVNKQKGTKAQTLDDLQKAHFDFAYSAVKKRAEDIAAITKEPA